MSFSPQMRASIPPCRQTPVSTIKQRYLISCPASRLAGLGRTHRVSRKPARPTRVVQSQGITSAMATCPDAPKTRTLRSHSGTWPCVSKGRETPGGRAYYTLLKSASSLSTSYCDNLVEKVHAVTYSSTIHSRRRTWCSFEIHWLTTTFDFFTLVSQCNHNVFRSVN